MGEIFVHESPRPTMANTGERLTTGHLLETELEHFHRYYLARHYARGRIVLDVASGEGYGAAILAQVATRVHGVDVSAEAVAHAQASYAAANLSFTQGDACNLPLPDGAVDMVTSFETIEHFLDHQGFLAEIKRVLRPGGLLIVSTPDRDIYSPPHSAPNTHHIHELSKDAFHLLCARYFNNVAVLTQSTVVGSAVCTDRPGMPTAPRQIFERRGETHVEATTGAMRGKFCLCIASDAQLPPLADSLLIHDTSIGSHAANSAGLATRISALQTALDQRNQDLATLNVFLGKREAFIREGMGAFTNIHMKAIDQHGRERVLLEQEMARLREAAASARAEAAALQATLAERERSALSSVVQLARAVRRRAEPLLDRVGLPSMPAIIRGSTLFDAAWYLETYPDVRRAGLDPARHYAARGAAEGRDPGPNFSTQAYLQAYPDVPQAGLNPLVHYERFGRAEGRAIPMPGAIAEPPPETAAPAGRRALHVVYISGEPHTPGHLYRVERSAAAAAAAGAVVTQLTTASLEADPDDALAAIASCALLVIWRAPLTDGLTRAAEAARAAGARILYDVDDLMFEPELAHPDFIDGIRSQNFDTVETAALFGRIAQAIGLADATSAPTRFLAGRLQRQGKASVVLPNGFDHATWRHARRAVRARRIARWDGVVRIGYAAGSRTHQKDFAVAVPAVVRALRAHPHARLVLFRSGHLTCIDIEEFPELDAIRHQIEWREMVSLDGLPNEIARFDISLAPLEPGNPFCEAKSELKYFESALVEVPLIASPTAVFREMIEPGRTGLLAGTQAEWDAALSQLLDDADLRARIGGDSYRAVLWPYGPERRVEQMHGLLAQFTGEPAAAARAFELELRRNAAPPAPAHAIAAHHAEILQDRMQDAAVSVVIPLYNYAHTVIEALASAACQSLAPLDLIVVDDCSTDDGYALARDWMLAHRDRFGRLILIRNAANVGLGPSRNIGFAHAETPYVIPLDADNRLRPDFTERCLAVADATGAAFVYPMIQTFGETDDIIGQTPYLPLQLASGNFIDAMALVRSAAWAAVGGYDNVRFGWEDYDLWCRFAEHGLFATHVPEILADYRVHAGSMLRTLTDLAENKRGLIADMRTRHPWVLDGVAAG